MNWLIYLRKTLPSLLERGTPAWMKGGRISHLRTLHDKKKLNMKICGLFTQSIMYLDLYALRPCIVCKQDLLSIGLLEPKGAIPSKSSFSFQVAHVHTAFLVNIEHLLSSKLFVFIKLFNPPSKPTTRVLLLCPTYRREN